VATSIAVAGIGAAAAVGGAAMSAKGGSAGGVPGSSKAMQSRAIINQEVATGTSDLENQLGKESMVQTERARQGIFDLLGTPGTYEESYEDFVNAGGGTGVGAPTGQFNLVQVREPLKLPVEALPGKGKGIYTKEELKAASNYKTTFGLVGAEVDPERTTSEGKAWIIDPDAYIKNVSQSRQFRMMSRMTAEADQLSRQQGPLWEKLKQSVTNPIIQSSAVAARELQESLARDAARGGTSRNRAVAVANKIQANNEILRDRTTALWTSSLAIKQWTQDNARLQTAFNQSWVSNLNGIRDNFTGMMQNAQQFYGAQILPSVVGASGNTAGMARDNSNTLADLAAAQASRDESMGNLVSGAIKAIGGGIMTAYANSGATPAANATMSGQSYLDVSGVA